MSSISALEELLGHTFQDTSLLKRALLHRSASQKKCRGYERLEFLGDRVLGLCVADLLMRAHKEEQEGSLSARLNHLVSGTILTHISQTLALESYVVFAGRHCPPSVLADICEALIGALYRDGGLAPAMAFVQRIWGPLLCENIPRDPKTTLQEWAQARRQALPVYEIIHREGPDHDLFFSVRVMVGEEGEGEGRGKSVRRAEQSAAHAFLEKHT